MLDRNAFDQLLGHDTESKFSSFVSSHMIQTNIGMKVNQKVSYLSPIVKISTLTFCGPRSLCKRKSPFPWELNLPAPSFSFPKSYHQAVPNHGRVYGHSDSERLACALKVWSSATKHPHRRNTRSRTRTFPSHVVWALCYGGVFGHSHSERSPTPYH